MNTVQCWFCKTEVVWSPEKKKWVSFDTGDAVCQDGADGWHEPDTLGSS